MSFRVSNNESSSFPTKSQKLDIVQFVSCYLVVVHCTQVYGYQNMKLKVR